mmetsp:Transcript_28006/g.61704  ORF Transcript_28006/g.61704 Transcript_28006/m.61704 type:complete len:83 (+) Transcript_28006:96-344(+)
MNMFSSKLNDTHYKSMFSSLDKDNSGFIDKSDLKILTKGMLPESNINMIMGFVDKNNDGKIDYKEFKAIMSKIQMAKKFMPK